MSSDGGKSKSSLIKQSDRQKSDVSFGLFVLSSLWTCSPSTPVFLLTQIGTLMAFRELRRFFLTHHNCDVNTEETAGEADSGFSLPNVPSIPGDDTAPC